ncbi:MAG: RodZ domain-containing protein [Alphaproteobacteria bacterium]
MMHSVEGADHVGAFLREARETTGRTVADVAQNLRIRRVYLEAIEDGRFDELPGATYAVGFVRSYAAYLRLDAPSLVARFKEEASGIQAPQELEFPTPVPEGRFPGGLLVTLSLLLGAAAFGGWYWLQSQNGIEVARVPPPPGEEQATAEVSAPPPGISGERTARVAGPVTGSVASETPTTAPASTVAETAIETAADTAEPAAPTISEPDDSAPASDASEVALVPETFQRPQGNPPAGDADAPTTAEAPPEISQVAPPNTQPDARPVISQVPNETVAVAEVPAPDVTTETAPTGTGASGTNMAEPVPVRLAVSEPAVSEPVVAAVPVDPTSDNVTSDNLASDDGTPAGEPAADTDVAVVTPAPAELSSEPAIIALPEIEDPQASASDAAPDREGRTYGARNSAARIILRAAENTWVQVRDEEENVVLTQMLQAGDRYMVPNRGGLRLMTGNAGGLDISVDGESVPAIGARGESRRDVRLDPELLMTGAAVVR